jgi:N-acetylglutamate synthase-like GNAT family acetyltransferase
MISDAEEILILQKLAYRSEAEIYNDFNIPPLVQTPESIEKDFENQYFLKAVMEGKIIGSVRAYTKEGTCYIGRLIVHPDFQNQGIGSSLIKRGFEESRRLGHTIVVVLGHPEYYPRFGFAVAKTILSSFIS